ncbi:MAG: Ni/Fe hydrogenase subunit alpha [Candidatus Sedimenticola endophacoides]|uniref:Ni/Fe hydrogenase subunit alpha n=2 Tax=Candidatus Sedimenticola endophacoides TaxID=2548426 RepID=A0A6N4E1Y5_9GAMM|nr:MAG: Ni/Fe hydrogenase subunit alpha [Candidatus Sedimenticola endophacoides]OQX41434.1 MAG: Ni/Fe hydrogenase subunit alpha [Candidatus Sedimenticola endophacoides]PUD99090.1 MAG: Ni/Fe hydrogenase subunit alpha [Candidatus Sedimenticola endophacoides]PUE02439.1 MAG: Ni/Fe hydrogenase subunit alpha [Candidatus Sedimenticola endophacoides]PUE03737.1 MAG: Ni/Fe hydrogenase subunit alpha [Candidatus Sedimenticola endophacoides]
MTDSIDRLETAPNPEGLRRVAIEPLTRVEGHGKVSLLLDERNRVAQARLHIVEFRGFEKFIQGRPYWELPVLVQRLCGICPVSHHLAAAKAVDQLVGVTGLSPTAEKVRRLMHHGQILQSHALHFFHLASPDLLFGYDAAVARRNIVGVLNEHPELAKQGVLLRKYGQEVIRLTAGKRVHGTGAIPGGVNKSLRREEIDYLKRDIARMVEWSRGALDLARRLFMADVEHSRRFARIETNLLSLCRDDGALELYHGGLRARRPDGGIHFDQVDYRDYETHIREQVKSWSYMKFPYISDLGPNEGAYRVGPLARINNCDFIDTPLAEAGRQAFRAFAGDTPLHSTLAYHWARMIEMLYCAESIARLLDDPDLSGDERVRRGHMQNKGIGVIEAPRGTLFHHYEIDDEGLVTRANLIVSTTNNNRAMNQSIRRVAADLFDGRELTEPMLNQIEVAIRAYDPCLSCATHALGRMPLEVELIDTGGNRLARLRRDGNGTIRGGDD